ncbi:uncharacterized protein N7496_011291 [Penicillium cataractarum]|uniref:Myosin class II heavy chain n=1 Tax=Penicillium cataractarum TaxID=2100454 RepID=A0A9W9REQ5_9EURO|nr:uncharacterized protein N7496_011291 [Penicillium cataractarum]KAJ5358878.1 hypothetical protein N7496_011291 [Penicillium cataractarum]
MRRSSSSSRELQLTGLSSSSLRPHLDQPVSSASAASSPFHPKDARILRDESHLGPSLFLSSPSSGESSPSTAGSPSQQHSPRSITLEPPQLPFLSAHHASRRPQESLVSSPETRRADSSVYYTTAWGSPYAAPSTRRLSLTLSQFAGVDQGSRESSPTSSVAADHPELRRASVAEGFTDQPLQGEKTIRDFTQDWINQYLSGQPRTEKSNWLSDDSGSEAPSFFTAKNHLADDLSDDWLGLEDDTRESDLLRTPTLSDFVGRRAAARAKGKKSQHKRADTLRQEDFWGFAYDKEPSTDIMADSQESQPPAEAVSPVEKPLPPPPASTADENTNTGSKEELSQPDAPKRQASDINTSSAPVMRRRKKLAWRGKACIIDLPNDDQRGTEQSGYRLLTREDVDERLKQWEQEGWDVRGFTIGDEVDPSATTELGGLSRPLYPDPYEVYEETKGQRPFIQFPDKAVWDAYVAELQEEKLRALGVSFGDPEPQSSISPASAAQTPFPGLVASPPIPTASAGSNPLGAVHPFSPHFGQPAGTTSGGIGSLASPASQFSVQTPFMGIEQSMMPGYPFQFQPTPPAQGSMTPQNLINIRQASGSVGPGSLANFNSMLSPVSPLHEQGAFHGFNEKAVWDNHYGHDGQDDGPPYPTPQTPVNAPDHFHASNVEIAHPTPRGHGHNLSETLQRGLDQMNHSEYRMDDQMEHHMNEDHVDHHRGFNPAILQNHWAMHEQDQHHQIQNNVRQPSHSFSQQPHEFYNHFGQPDVHEGSDLETNPSLTGTPHVRGVLPNQGPWHESKASHHSKLSISSLNVDAKPFDPTASFASQQGAFGNNAFQFGGMDGMAQSGFGFAPAPSFAPVNVMNGSIHHNPVPEPEPEPKPSSFKFSAASFNVDAPVFNPSASLNSNASSEQASGSRTKIFGDIDFAEIAKPPKQSKAIPIVRPDEIDSAREEEHEQATMEDAEGRPVPTDRHKRARRAIGHAQGEARYSISTQPLGEAGNAQAQTSGSLHILAEGKENALPEDDKHAERRGTPMSEATTWTLFDVKNEGDEARSRAGSNARPEQTEEVKEEPVAEAESEQTAPAREQKPVKHALQDSRSSIKSTMLSPTAQPFEFKPAVSSFVPTSVPTSDFAQQKPVEPEPVKIEETQSKPVEKQPAKGGLMASRFATASPPKPAPAAVERSYVEQTPQPRHDLSRWQESAEESPDDEELNAIMEQLNDDSDVGIERQHTPLPPHFVSESAPTKEHRFGSAEARSEAPSPSPGGGQKTYKLNIPKLGSDIDAASNATFSPQKSLISRIQSPVRQLITENDHVSDWDDMISSGEDEKFFNRNRFFDRRINDIVGSAIDDRLTPMERALAVIQQSVATIASGTASRRVFRSTSAEMDESDADDEDDEGHESSVRERSPHHMRDRKLEMLKSVVMEALVTHDMPNRGIQHSSHSEMAQLKESIAELQALTIKKLAQDPVGDMREILEESLVRHMAQQTPRLSEADEIGADSLMLQIDGLKSMLRLADERSETEYRLRREATDSVGELQQLLKVAEEDAARHSAAAEDAEARLLQFKEEKIPHLEKMQFRSESLAEESETLKVTIAELSTKNIALEGTLDEYRVSADSFRRQLETTKAENSSLHETVDALRTRIEDSMAARQNLTEKFDRLQTDMVNVTADVAREQASWRRKDEEQAAKYNELLASFNREVKLREKLEEEVAVFEKQEKEAAKVKFLYEQSQQENVKMEETIAVLRAENHNLQLTAARFEREFNEARESSRMEIQRTRTSMEADLEASNSQVNIVRAELEAQILRLETQLDNVRLDADTSRERYEMFLEEAKESRLTALATANESRELALEEQRKTHERVLNDLRERHARALHNSSEDRQRGEAHMIDRLALADDRAKHLEDRVQHLEEKLEIAQSAARAAAEAAQTAKAAPTIPLPTPAAPTHSTSPSMSFSKGSQEPERISPQALRESIFVLQDQLQQRETRIEELEQEVASMDKDAPNKIKERDSEINWLRELLGVRIDDLQDIIKTLSQPSFNQHAVRDAAIRLKANLQMQQQERERTLTGSGLPSLQSLTELAASPRSLPLAAAAAWGNWRKARESANGGSTPSEQTPSKSSNAGAFLSGLLTPPSSHARQNAPNTSGPGRAYAETRPLRGFNSTPRRGSVRQEVPITEPPKTPPLLRRSSYDHDAEPANYEEGNFASDDIESTVDGMVSASPKDSDEGPFGPSISAEAIAEE